MPSRSFEGGGAGEGVGIGTGERGTGGGSQVVTRHSASGYVGSKIDKTTSIIGFGIGEDTIFGRGPSRRPSYEFVRHLIGERRRDSRMRTLAPFVVAFDFLHPRQGRPESSPGCNPGERGRRSKNPGTGGKKTAAPSLFHRRRLSVHPCRGSHRVSECPPGCTRGYSLVAPAGAALWSPLPGLLSGRLCRGYSLVAPAGAALWSPSPGLLSGRPCRGCSLVALAGAALWSPLPGLLSGRPCRGCSLVAFAGAALWSPLPGLLSGRLCRGCSLVAFAGAARNQTLPPPPPCEPCGSSGERIVWRFPWPYRPPTLIPPTFPGTPMMRQYQRIRAGLPSDILLFFRLGDFYELFFDDAKEASAILNVTLTKRQETPMCGVPFHAAEHYIKKLILAGKRVAVCDQKGEVLPGKARRTRGHANPERRHRHGPRAARCRQQPLPRRRVLQKGRLRLRLPRFDHGRFPGHGTSRRRRAPR